MNETMNCEYCDALLSAGDITVVPRGEEISFKVICHSCDRFQENSKVLENNGMFFIIEKNK